ncbi:hypothetical protein M569_12551, partial [Genlisea aurea]
DAASRAIEDALKALKKRHLLEEGAHSPAFVALSRPIVSQGSVWKEKVESLQEELQQFYRAQSRLSEQLVVEVSESRASKALVQEKEALISDLQTELKQSRWDECSRLASLLDEKTKALELLISEHKEVKAQLEEASIRANNAEAETKNLIDRWMLEKMNDAERLNEANAIYESMMSSSSLKESSSIQLLAHRQADGLVRHFEEGAEYYVASPVPSAFKQKIVAHEGGCGAIAFEHGSSKLISGGQDKAVKIWDTATGSSTQTLHGCLGSVLDLCLTHDSKSVIAASSANTLYVWDVASGRIRHTLTGHMEKVCTVDASRISSRNAVSAAYDRTIKIWDLQKGYCASTLLCHSNCNAVRFSMDGKTVFSGHVDGNLRLWDIENGRILSEVAAHSSAVTSLSISRNGNLILSSGRDNQHKIFDVRTVEMCSTVKGNGRVASNWSRSCMSPDDGYVLGGSVDGDVNVWSVSSGKMVSTMKEHGSPVLCCSWSNLGKPVASSDKNGNICIWT